MANIEDPTIAPPTECLDNMLRQCIYGDFSGDNHIDLRMALSARTELAGLVQAHDSLVAQVAALKQQATVNADHTPKVRVWGWVWRDKLAEDGCCYIPCYTPDLPSRNGELLALVDPVDLSEPLNNTLWHSGVPIK